MLIRFQPYYLLQKYLHGSKIRHRKYKRKITKYMKHRVLQPQ